MSRRVLTLLIALCAAASPWTASADDWHALIELVEGLPDDLDTETRQLIVDLLAETGGFASAVDSLPRNTLRAPSEPSVRFSVLSRAEGVLEMSVEGGGPAGATAGDWDSFDSRTYLRVRGDLPAGFTVGGAVERDPGERDAFDHVGGYLRWDAGALTSGTASRGAAPSWGSGPRGWGATLIAGDAVVEWGQRLIAGAPSFGTPGGPGLRDRLRGYDGAAESVSRRGVAATLTTGVVDVSAFATRTSLDAGLDDGGNVTTFRSSGTHVTEGERSGRDALRESALGVRIVRTFGVAAGSGPADVASARVAEEEVDRGAIWRLGASVVSLRYDRLLVRSDPERSRFGFEGDALELYGVDLSGRVRSLRWGAEFAVLPPSERAALITIEGRPGRARVLLGVDIVSRGFWSPLGSSPPGASSGGNCVSSWLKLSYSAREGWGVWCRGQVTGHEWRTYNDPLPPHVTAAAVGGRVRLGGALLTAEASGRGESGTSAEPHVTEFTRARRERFSLSVGRDRRWRLWLARSARTKDGAESGRRAGVGCSLTAPLGALGDRLDLGVTLVSAEGSAPTLYAGEPGLPGAFGLRSLKGSGAGWYIRARKALPAGAFVTVRAARSSSGEELTLGLAIEAGVTSRR